MADIAQMIADAAASYGVAPALALEVATAESNLNQAAVSSAGAIGIFQLMPATARSLGVDPTDPTQNIKGGVMLLAQLLGRFGDIREALAAYNWNPSSVAAAMAQYGSDWLSHAPSETQNYVAKILNNLGTQYTASVTQPAPDASQFYDGMVDPGDVPIDTSSSLLPILLMAAGGVLLLFLLER